MHTHYLDLELLPDPEIGSSILLSALYGRLHLALVQSRSEAIAVSFPGYDAGRRQLGDRLRIIGSPEQLERLMARAWLGGLRDQVSIRPIRSVPATAVHRTLRRVQAKSSVERLRRRHMRRHGLSLPEAMDRVPDSAAERLSLPAIAMRSASTGQTFSLFLRLGPASPHAIPGRFNSYGLSSTGTIPCF